jgi:23S rRNA (uracil1939-C5)-methyltransferase
MLPYEKQLQYKQQEVTDQMKRIGKIILPEMPPAIGSGATTSYRNKLEFTFSSKKYYTQQEIDSMPMHEDGPRGLPSIPALGFHVPGSFDKVIDIQEVGKRFSGLYYVTSTEHHYSHKSGYQTSFTARRTAS